MCPKVSQMFFFDPNELYMQNVVLVSPFGRLVQKMYQSATLCNMENNVCHIQVTGSFIHVKKLNATVFSECNNQYGYLPRSSASTFLVRAAHFYQIAKDTTAGQKVRGLRQSSPCQAAASGPHRAVPETSGHGTGR